MSGSPHAAHARLLAAHPRWLGAALGFAIAGVFVIGAAVLDALLELRIAGTLLIPSMLAGTLGGTLVGSRAAGTDWTPASWTRFTMRLRLACLAVVIGAFAVAAQWALDGYFSSDPNGGLAQLLVGIPALTALGILGLGPVFLPFAFVAAFAWTEVMRRLAPPGAYRRGHA
jgi:hypothetical protein